MFLHIYACTYVIYGRPHIPFHLYPQVYTVYSLKVWQKFSTPEIRNVENSQPYGVEIQMQ